jgi:hypothetical protein
MKHFFVRSNELPLKALYQALPRNGREIPTTGRRQIRHPRTPMVHRSSFTQSWITTFAMFGWLPELRCPHRALSSLEEGGREWRVENNTYEGFTRLSANTFAYRSGKRATSTRRGSTCRVTTEVSTIPEVKKQPVINNRRSRKITTHVGRSEGNMTGWKKKNVCSNRAMYISFWCTPSGIKQWIHWPCLLEPPTVWLVKSLPVLFPKTIETPNHLQKDERKRLIFTTRPYEL